MQYRVVFVCLGNICRSPTAENVLRSLVVEQGVEEIVGVDSAGTGDWHIGEAPDRRMREAAAQRGYRLTGRARTITGDELGSWTKVIAMDRQNLADLRSLPGAEQASLHLFSEFLPPGSPEDVPDPYYGGPDGFDRVIDLVEEGCTRLLEEILAEGGGD